MKKFLTKTKTTFLQLQSQSQSQTPLQPSQTTPSKINPPAPLDLLRYRYHHGINLGSIFVLEQWLFPSLFPSPASTPGSSELSALLSSLSAQGPSQTRQKWEQHYSSALTPSDLSFLSSASCTTIRLPIGYFTLPPSLQFCSGTPFSREDIKSSGVYDNAWNFVLEMIRKCRTWGIGVLLDFHAVPGGANGEAHSGTDEGKAGLWGDKKHLENARRALLWIVGEVGKLENEGEYRYGKGGGVVGIQVCNEASYNAKGVWDWYDSVITSIGEVDPTIPIIISDCWDLDRTLKWCISRKSRKGKGKGGAKNPIVVDTHRYYTFSESDRAQSPQQIIARIPGELGELQGKPGSVHDRGEVQIIVGEYSSVLDGATWSKSHPSEKEALVREFSQAQCRTWEHKTGGSFFWTFKMEWMDGGEWGFTEQVKKGNITSPAYMMLGFEDVRRRLGDVCQRREGLKGDACREHEAYWERTCPGKRFEHWLFAEGWDLGFEDAKGFFGMRANGVLGDKVERGGDRIGCLEIWVGKRVADTGVRGEFVWEWEQGFRRGVRDLEVAVGI